ncbi:DoxX family protein [uncultured Vibrio sp.]|uniref:DoxX family protein n=1 Tax=uncultured Vibrio sp. TaxID=114054 RepID=UPI002AAB8973|nr:DoxX family protein [uncultured Vibrio sp.]
MAETIKRLITHYDGYTNTFKSRITPLLLLTCRFWVAWVFFNSGLVKVASWQSTLYLFEFEYQVPLLPWELAAYLGTATELIVPIFIALGVFTRPMAIVLFVFNIIAVLSYPLLWEKGFHDHKLWGLMILVVLVWGPGRYSCDQFLRNKLAK